MQTCRSALRENYARWLSEEFGVNTKSTGERAALFGIYAYEILLRTEDGKRITFNCRGEFHIIESVGPRMRDVTCTLVSVPEGRRIMRAVGEAHDLHFDWDGGNMTMTSRKMFCMDRKFTLARVDVIPFPNSVDFFDDALITEFEVRGADTWPQFPRSTPKPCCLKTFGGIDH